MHIHRPLMGCPARRRVRAVVSAIAVASLASLAACGDDDTEATGSTADPASSEAGTLPAADEVSSLPTDESTVATAVGSDADLRVVSLSPTHTEIMFAIGAGERLVAVDDQSNFPAEALDLPHDLSGFEPNVEAIAGYAPDIVLIGGDFTGLGDQLAELDIESWDGPAATTLDDTYAQIEQLGALTGHVGEAAALVGEMQADIDAIVGSAPVPDEPLTYYHELDPTFFSVDSTTFLGELYGLLGLRSIADQIESDAGGFPQLNAEFIVSTDPDVIFLADTKCCGESAATVAARDGWSSIAAVENGAVVELDDDIASRWGPRVVDLLQTVSDALNTAGVPS